MLIFKTFSVSDKWHKYLFPGSQFHLKKTSWSREIEKLTLIFETRGRYGGVIGANLLCQRQKGLWKVFFKCDIHCCGLFTHACAFIYRMVPHHELSNVLWTVNFPNAVPCPSSTLAYKHSYVYTHRYTPQWTTHMHSHNTPLKSPFVELLPQLYWVLRHLSAHIYSQRISDESICHKNPVCPFEACVRVVKLLSPINQGEYNNIVYKLSSLSNVAEHVNLI